MASDHSSAIHVTRSFLPPLEEYQTLVQGIFERGILTNYGPLVQELEQGLQRYLDVEHAVYMGNGTLALQLAIRVLGLGGEVITTPYSYVATTSSILWENCVPVFSDIDPTSFCIDPDLIEERITERTSAILATHVYGIPCAVERIAAIANKHGLKVIYDGAHAFGTKFKGRSLFSYGDLSTASFHATKLFHTSEGGAVFTSNAGMNEALQLLRSFGHRGDTHFSLGINAKNSEFHAAMGVCNLRYMNEVLAVRKAQWQQYHNRLSGQGLGLISIPEHTEYNCAYFAVVFQKEAELQKVLASLAEKNIYPRRYFYPSLNTLPYVEGAGSCPVSEGVASRVLCLPLYHTLEIASVNMICDVVLGGQ